MGGRLLASTVILLVNIFFGKRLYRKWSIDLCPFITGVASFRYEIDISLPLVGVRSNRRTIRSVSSQSTTVTLALYIMSRRSEGLSGQATRPARIASNRVTL